MADYAYLQRLSRELTDAGKLIEAGWVTLRMAAIPRDASPTQLSEMRLAYMAGAQHLFSSIMTILEPDAEPTDTDLARMDLIHKELEAFRQELELWVGKPKGRA